MKWVLPQFLLVALQTAAAPEQLYHQVKGSEGCWVTCGHKTGKCERVCGKDGYCCRQGYNCPAKMDAVALKWRHSCVIPVPDQSYHQVAGSEGCWATCGNKGGKCENVCGTNGYCCRQGYNDCPSKIAVVALSRRHSCLIPIPEKSDDSVLPCAQESYVQVAGSEGCWAQCGNKGGKCESFCGENGYCCRQGHDDCPAKMHSVALITRHSCVIAAPKPKISKTKWYKSGTCTYPLPKTKCMKYGRRKKAIVRETSDANLPHGCLITIGKNKKRRTIVKTVIYNIAASCTQCGIYGIRCVCYKEQ